MVRMDPQLPCQHLSGAHGLRRSDADPLDHSRLLQALKDIVTPVPKLFFSPTLENFVTILQNPSIRRARPFGHRCRCVRDHRSIARRSRRLFAGRHVRALKDDMQFFVLSLRFMPPVAIAIPFIVLYLDLGLYDTLAGLILVLSCDDYLDRDLALRARIRARSQEIEEAAAMEGCGPGEIFLKFALPIAMPSLFGALVFTFVLVWNDTASGTDACRRNATLPVVPPPSPRSARKFPGASSTPPPSFSLFPARVHRPVDELHQRHDEAGTEISSSSESGHGFASEQKDRSASGEKAFVRSARKGHHGKHSMRQHPKVLWRSHRDREPELDIAITNSSSFSVPRLRQVHHAPHDRGLLRRLLAARSASAIATLPICIRGARRCHGLPVLRALLNPL